jgi:hypothetical protein
MYVNGNMFLYEANEGITFKLDAEGMKQANTVSGAKPAQINGWVEVPSSANADWLGLAELAYRYVLSLPPKAAKPKKKKK